MLFAISHSHVTMHHCKLSQLISINLLCVTTVLIIKNATVLVTECERQITCK